MPEKTWEVLPPDEPPRSNGQRSAWDRQARIAAAFAVAIVSDALSVWLEFAPPLQWALDVGTALALFLILGRQWMLVPALVAEAIPGIAVFPAWVLVVGSIAMWGTIKR
jgi:hypothetical protein